MWKSRVFCMETLTYGVGEACQHPGETLSLQLLPSRLTVAWKNNCTRKTIKTTLAKFLPVSVHSLRCGEIMTCRKIPVSVLFAELKCECLIRKFPGARRGVYKTLLLVSPECFPEPHSSSSGGSSIMTFYWCCSQTVCRVRLQMQLTSLALA